MQEPVTKQNREQVRIGLKGHLVGRWPGLLALAVALCLLVWFFPFGASAYHLERGSQALTQATSGGDHPDLDLLANAVVQLEKALSWQGDNAYAYRLLSRAYLLQETPAEAEQALIRYSALRPGDPLGWRELAQIYETMDMPEQAMVAWRSGGFIAQDFIDAGDEARQANRYEDALEWYERALSMEAEDGDPWYHIGLLYEDQQQWSQALNAYRNALASKRLRRVSRSSLYYRSGVIYLWHMAPRQSENALASYQAAIKADDFHFATQAADCHYQLGEILRWRGEDPDKYIAEYQLAIKLDPDHASAHIYLGTAYYNQSRDVARAKAEIDQGLELDPRNKWGYYQLGEIYRQEGDTAEAIIMYQRALEIDPDFEVVQTQLEILNDGK
jgi:tetratricopeptide (TPR) repeat protein